MTDKLRARFKAYFDAPGVELPSPIPPRGQLNGGGWTVKYVLGKAADGQPYVDFFAENRHTNSRHVRITAEGQDQSLENYQEAMIFDEETGDDWGKASAKQQAHNRKVTEILESKGLLS